MSLAAYMWVADLPLDVCGPTAFRVLLKYADRVNELGYHGWHTEEYLAETLGCSTRTIRRARLELVDAGLLRVSDDQDGPQGRTGHRPKVYDVLTPALSRHEQSGGTFLSWSRMTGGTHAGRQGGHLLSTETVPETTYQDFLGHQSLVTAREGAMSR
jgi:hypothetical protein